MSIETLAQDYENSLSRIYLWITVTVVLCSAGISALIFILVEFSAFTVIEAIGTWLFFIVIGMAVLQHGKRKKFDAVMETVRMSSDLCEEDFMIFLRKNAVQYELALSEMTKKLKAGAEPKVPAEDVDKMPGNFSENPGERKDGISKRS